MAFTPQKCHVYKDRPGTLVRPAFSLCRLRVGVSGAFGGHPVGEWRAENAYVGASTSLGRAVLFAKFLQHRRRLDSVSCFPVTAWGTRQGVLLSQKRLHMAALDDVTPVPGAPCMLTKRRRLASL